MTMQQISGSIVLLASEDADFGLVNAHDARDQARQLAAEEGVVIYIRDPTTDEIVDTVDPIRL